MDVIGNNIANVNTAGYKTSRVIFQDIFSQNVSAGMANQGQIGGTNPKQIGLGIRLSTVDVIHTRAAFQRTDRETDMMINGDGFFIVAQQNPETGEFEPFYTRAGNFDIDNDGFLVTSSGLFVLGTSFEMETGVVDPGSLPIAARASLTRGQFTAFFDEVDDFSVREFLEEEGIDEDYFDDPLINEYIIPAGAHWPGIASTAPLVLNPPDGSGRALVPPAPIRITEANLPNYMNPARPPIPGHPAVLPVEVPADGFRPGDIIPTGTFEGPGGTTVPATQTTITLENIHFWNDGQPRTLADTMRWPATNRPAFNAVAQRFPIFGIVQGAENAGLNKIRVQTERLIIPDANPDTGLPFGAPEREADESVEAYTTRLEIWLTNLADTAATEEISLPGFAVAENGDISVIVANRKVIIGRLAIGMFSNPAGLEKGGNSLYRESASSGPVVVTEAFSDGAGKIDGGGLEMSNVDLSNEFTDMIVTQRGFQANSRIITVSDTMLEELVNLKR